MVTNPAQRPGPSRAGVATAVLAAAYALVFSWVCIVKYRYYLYDDFDFAIFAQAMEQMLRGSFYTSIRGMVWLGDHSSLILLPLLPVYAVLRHPVALLVIQSLALALGALPAFAIARRELRHAWAAFAFAALYLLHPAVGYANLFEFHPETLATPALLFTFQFLLEGRFARTLLAATLALMCREDVALVVLPLALWALWVWRVKGVRFAAALAALAAASLVLSFLVLGPAFNRGEAGYAQMYAGWGTSLGQVVANVLRHPVAAAADLVRTHGDAADSALKREYYVLMLAPLMFLPLLSPPTTILALPVLMQHFLSWRPAQHAIVYQYTALVTPVLVVAAILGARNAAGWLAGQGANDTSSDPRGSGPQGTRSRRTGPQRSNFAPRGARGAGRSTRGKAEARTPGNSRRQAAALGLAAAALLASLVCNSLYGPLTGSSRVENAVPPQRSAPDPLDRTMKPYRDRMVREIPAAGGVVASFEFLPHVARRADVHSAHHVFSGRYTFSERPYPVPGGIGAFLANATDDRMVNYIDALTGARLRALIARNGLACADAAGDLLLFARGARDTLRLIDPNPGPVDHPANVTFDSTIVYLGASRLAKRARPGAPIELITYWRRLADTDRLYFLVLALFDPAGHLALRRIRLLGYVTDTIDTWPKGQAMAERYRLVLPSTLPSGAYTLAATLSFRRGASTAYAVPDDPAVAAGGGFVTLGTVQVGP